MATNSFDSSIPEAKTSSSTMEFSALAKTHAFDSSIKLTSNYTHWKAQVLAAIRALELEDLISELKTPPAQFVFIQGDEASSSVEARASDEFKAWKMSDQLLLSRLFSTVSSDIIVQALSDCKTSLEFWKTLEKIFSQQSTARVLQLKLKLQTIRKGTMSISEFILQVKSIGEELKAAGEVVTDYDLILQVLLGVGHEYEPVVVLVSYQQKTMTFQEVEDLLMLHEQRIMERLNSGNMSRTQNQQWNNQSNFRGNNSSRSGGGRNQQNVYCQVCVKGGHMALQCYHRFYPTFLQSQRSYQQ